MAGTAQAVPSASAPYTVSVTPFFMLITAVRPPGTLIGLWPVVPYQVVSVSIVKTSLSERSFTVAAEAEIAATVAIIAKSIFFITCFLSNLFNYSATPK